MMCGWPIWCKEWAGWEFEAGLWARGVGMTWRGPGEWKSEDSTVRASGERVGRRGRKAVGSRRCPREYIRGFVPERVPGLVLGLVPGVVPDVVKHVQHMHRVHSTPGATPPSPPPARAVGAPPATAVAAWPPAERKGAGVEAQSSARGGVGGQKGSSLRDFKRKLPQHGCLQSRNAATGLRAGTRLRA
eukprot:357479-Chlamydomonas_euryale.AAC.5